MEEIQGHMKLQQMDFSCFLLIIYLRESIFLHLRCLLHLVMGKICDHLVLQDVYFHRGEYPCTAIGDGGDGCLAVCSAGGICDAVHICRLL